MSWAELLLLLLLLLHIYLGPWLGAPFLADWWPRFERRVLVQIITYICTHMYEILENTPSSPPAFEKLVRVRKKRKKESGPDRRVKTCLFKRPHQHTSICALQHRVFSERIKLGKRREFNVRRFKGSVSSSMGEWVGVERAEPLPAGEGCWYGVGEECFI